jgi:hypothetical protein
MPSSSNTLEIQQLLAGEKEPLQQLLTSQFSSPCGNKTAISSEQLFALLAGLSNAEQTLASQVVKQLNDEQGLNDFDFALLTFVDHLFRLHGKNNQLDEQINQCLQKLKPQVAVQLLRQPDWLSDQEQPLQAAIALIQCSCSGWEAGQGRITERFLEQLNEQLDELCQAHDSSAQQHGLEQLQATFDKDLARRKKLQQRICETEQGALKARYARQVAAKTLNQRMAGKQLPANIVDFLKQHWLESLRLQVLKHGEQSSVWQQLLALTKQLIDSFQPMPEDDKQAHFKAIADLPEQLSEFTISINHQEDILATQLAMIEEQHLLMLRGENLNYADFELIDNSNPLLANQVHISKGLLKQIDSLKTGQWFIDKDQPPPRQRIQLIDKLNGEQQLLFSNFSGAKAASYNFEEFAYRLSSRTVQPCPGDHSLGSSARQLFDSLLKLHNHQQQKRAQQQQQDREVAQQKALAEAADLAAAEQQQQQAKQQRAELAAQQQAAQQQKGRKAFGRIMVGSLLHFTIAGRPPETLKLAVKLQSTGRHVFTDNSGIKRLDISSEQLLELLIKGQAVILRSGDQFEDSLQKVVDGIRNRKG